jgi:hypothetical protein
MSHMNGQVSWKQQIEEGVVLVILTYFSIYGIIIGDENIQRLRLRWQNLYWERGFQWQSKVGCLFTKIWCFGRSVWRYFWNCNFNWDGSRCEARQTII